MMETPKLPLVLLSLEERPSKGMFPGCSSRHQSGCWATAAGKKDGEEKLMSQASAWSWSCFKKAISLGKQKSALMGDCILT